MSAATPTSASTVELASFAQGFGDRTVLTDVDLTVRAGGRGFLLTDSQNNGRTDRLFLAIILLAVLGKVTDAVLGTVEKRALRKWTA